jgi:DNA-binding CsgD family transcriptional regulator
VTLVARQRRTSAGRERELSRRLAEAEEQSRLRGAETQDLLRGLSDQIDRQFEKWGLTAAEREIALLMLKGLRHKEIAGVRGTSERTVRQQALTIYKKAGLDGRTDLTAFFLEDLLQPVEAGGRRSA